MTYEELQDEFNRRQIAGEPCDELVTEMIAALSLRIIPPEAADETPPRPRLIHERPTDE